VADPKVLAQLTGNIHMIVFALKNTEDTFVPKHNGTIAVKAVR
jgi:hypothetical protein